MLEEMVRFSEIQDVMLVPVSINVDLPIQILGENHGSARVDFEQPFSLKVKATGVKITNLLLLVQRSFRKKILVEFNFEHLFHVSIVTFMIPHKSFF